MGAASRWIKPDLLYSEGALRPDLALEVDEAGRVMGVRPLGGDPGGPVARLARQVLFPGQSNAHSHAFQRLIRGRGEYRDPAHSADDFWTWRERMYQAAVQLGPEELRVVSRQAFIEMAEAGITAVGEFHYLHHRPDAGPYDDPDELAAQVVEAAREVGLRICLLRVGYARSGFRLPENPLQRRFKDAGPEAMFAAAERLRARYRSDPLVSVGLGPHSVRAVTREWLAAVASHTRSSGELVHMHVAEQPAEVSACQSEHGRTPVALLDELGLLGPRFTAVHAVHVAPEEIARLGASGARVCACPSTERSLGDGVVPADALAAAGVALSLGSDSQAVVDVLEEARLLEGHLRLQRQHRALMDPGRGDPDGLARTLVEIATSGGAASLGLSSGSLRPGAPADYFTLDLDHPSLAGAGHSLSAMLFGAEKGAIRELVVAGKTIVHEGRHPLRESSRRAFDALAQRF